MSDQPTLEILSDGLTSTFWEWFGQHVTREWGPSGMRYQQAVRDASKDPNAVIELQKVLHTQEAILSLMRHPSEVVQKMRAQKRAELLPTASRRGPGL